jgi:hypothetical protein
MNNRLTDDLERANDSIRPDELDAASRSGTTVAKPAPSGRQSDRNSITRSRRPGAEPIRQNRSGDAESKAGSRKRRRTSNSSESLKRFEGVPDEP